MEEVLKDQTIQDILKLVRELKALLLVEKKPFLSLEEACRYAGIKKNTMYIYTSKSIIPHYKVQNRKIYIKKDDLDNFILSRKNRISTYDEISEEITKLNFS